MSGRPASKPRFACTAAGAGGHHHDDSENDCGCDDRDRLTRRPDETEQEFAAGSMDELLFGQSRR